MTPRPRREPRLDLIERCRRVVGVPRGERAQLAARRVIECGIYRAGVCLELRCGYGDDPLQLLRVTGMRSGRALAGAWRPAEIDKSFAELRGYAAVMKRLPRKVRALCSLWPDGCRDDVRRDHPFVVTERARLGYRT